jgi:hypothetical protein
MVAFETYRIVKYEGDNYCDLKTEKRFREFKRF